MSTLYLTIKKKYFDQILNGEKTVEYRAVSPRLLSRLKKQYDTITLRNGYNANSPELICKLISYGIEKIKHEFFGNDEIDVIAFKLGEIVSTNNLR